MRKNPRTTELYRHYNSDGELLYVGISYDSLDRYQTHRKYAVWWSMISKMTVEKFSDRKVAEDAERKAIREENPKYNKQHLKSEEKQEDLPIQMPEQLALKSKPSRYGYAILNEITDRVMVVVIDFEKNMKAIVPTNVKIGDTFLGLSFGIPEELDLNWQLIPPEEKWSRNED